jgi:hypothetical protein
MNYSFVYYLSSYPFIRPIANPAERPPAIGIPKDVLSPIWVTLLKDDRIDALKKSVDECLLLKIKPVMASAAISGLFAIFHDDNGEYFRIKNIPDTNEARHILDKLGLDVSNSVDNVKENARCSLAGSDRHSNVV